MKPAFLDKLSPEYATMHIQQSREAIAAIGQIDECPTCHGKRRLGLFMSRAHAQPSAVFDCPTCGGTGGITRPSAVFDYIGGWDCCPLCHEGQHSNGPDVPCDVCQWIMEQLNNKVDDSSIRRAHCGKDGCAAPKSLCLERLDNNHRACEHYRERKGKWE